MRVLVPRPAPAAARTAATLTGLGHEAVVLPLTRAVHDPEAIRSALASGHSALAITSAEAARAMGDLGEALAPHHLTTVFAVGKASAQAAAEAGFRTVLTAGGDGKDLADFIIRHLADHGAPADPLLYLTGHPRAPHFEQRLAEAKIPLRTIDAYHMEPVAPKRSEAEAALLKPVPHVVLLYSEETARTLFALPPFAETPERFDATLFLCISRNVARAVPVRYKRRTIAAPAPNEDSLIGLI